MKLTLLKLPYAYDALEPHIDARTMEIHHTKHHAGYTKKLSVALEEAGNLDVDSIEDLLRNLDSVPEGIRTAVRNNGGGYVNHNLFWTIMSPDGGGQPTEPLGSALKSKFGDLSTFMERFADAALGRFGSGWAWLVLDENDDLLITDTPNQDSPLMHGQTPILGLDVWEHAYYLKYQNRRPDYVAAWWETVNWPAVARRYETALEKAGATV